MQFDKDIHTPNQAFALATRAAFHRAAEGPRKDRARGHLLAADRAETGCNEAAWILEIDRAARALASDPPGQSLAQQWPGLIEAGRVEAGQSDQVIDIIEGHPAFLEADRLFLAQRTQGPVHVHRAESDRN